MQSNHLHYLHHLFNPVLLTPKSVQKTEGAAVRYNEKSTKRGNPFENNIYNMNDSGYNFSAKRTYNSKSPQNKSRYQWRAEDPKSWRAVCSLRGVLY